MCAWEKSSQIAKSQLNRRGIKDMVMATNICQYAEKISSVSFTAISYRKGIMKIRISRDNLIDLKMIQGSLSEELAKFADSNNIDSFKKILIDTEP